MKILHLALNDKFIAHAHRCFENAFPGCNEVKVFSNPALQFQFIGHPDFKPLRLYDFINPLFLRTLKKYDAVIVHALYPHFVSLINRAPTDVKFIWIGWGFDYNRYIYGDYTNMLLPLSKTLTPAKKNYPVKNLIKKIFKADNHVGAISRMRAFAPVLHEDYERIVKAKILKNPPPYTSWHYGSLEDNWVKNYMHERVDGSNILLGNSADLTNNHLDALELLSRIPALKNPKIISTLSYAGGSHVASIIQKGNELFGDRFVPLENFMPQDDYIRAIKSCGFVVMNHIRQQGVGTIILMMHLGAKIFLREECPTYEFFKKHGAVIFSVQELEKKPDLLNHPLSKEDVARNIAVLEKFWSKDAMNARTRALVKSIAGAA